ncbi:MAG: peptidylprolyl isomerase [Proteobacteria bacterium]|nr:peptidylprolyl isomerase [Pseudomonadota bacterium]
MITDKARNVLGKQRVSLEFDVGTVVVKTLNWEAPITVANFLSYVRSGFYDQMLVHRAIDDFMIQMGLVEVLGTDDNGLVQWQTKTPGAPIVNESSNGLANIRGSLSMARTSDPDSATAQFFINQVNNAFLNHGSSGNPDGYAVFARVVSGMPVVDEIAAEPTTSVQGIGNDVPARGVLLKSVSLL